MSASPLVSVIIPAYNHERYVQETLRSIMAQTYRNIELIVVDDGSRDGTYQKIEELRHACEKRFTRVVFHTQPNAGTCTTFNRLLQEAQGEYVYLIASDDAAAPHAIETLLLFLAKHPDYVLAVGDNAFINAESERIGWNEAHQSTPLAQATYPSFGSHLQAARSDVDFHSDQFGSYLTLSRGNYVPNGYLMRADALRQTGGFTKEAPLEDLYLMLQLAKLGRMKYIDDILFSYRWHDTNTARNIAHMEALTHKTLLYEYSLVRQNGMKRWLKWFEKANSRPRVKFKIGGLLRYKKVEFLDGTLRTVLDLFGMSFILKVKPLPSAATPEQKN